MQVALKRSAPFPIQENSHDTLETQQILTDLNTLISNDINTGTGTYPKTKLDFLLIRGHFYNATSNYENALIDYFQIIDLDSTEKYKEVSLYAISNTYFEMNCIDSAISYADQLIKESTSYRKINYLLERCEFASSIVNWKITILEKSGRKKELVRFYQKLIWYNRIKFRNDNAKCFLERLKDFKKDR